MSVPARLVVVMACSLILAACAGSSADLAQRIASYEPSELESMDRPVVLQYRELKARAVEALRGGASGRERARALGRLGGWYLVFAMDDRARELLETARELDPADPEWPALLGRLAWRGNDMDAARRYWQQALDVNPGVPSLKVSIAETFMEQNRLDEAEALLKEIPTLPGVAARLLFDRGRIALLRGDAAEAVAQLGRALVHDPESTSIRYQLGQAYRLLGDEERARTYLAAGEERVSREGLPPMASPDLVMLQEFQQSARHLSDRARTLWDRGRRAEALSLLRRAVAADPDRAELRSRLGAYLERDGQTAPALENYQQALALDPEQVAALTGLVRIYRAQGEHQKVRDTLEALLAQRPDSARPRLELARYEVTEGRVEEALALVEEAVAADPRHEMARLLRLWLLLLQNRPEEALEAVTGDVALLPASTRLAGMLIRIQLHCDPEPCAADTLLERARALQQTEPTRFNAETLAMTLARLGRMDEAIRIQQAVVDSLSDVPNARLRALSRARLADYQSGQWRTTMLHVADLQRSPVETGSGYPAL